jgi:hypothetical protein
MKTPGRITATLIALLTLYVLGYWLLFKEEWAYNSLHDIRKPWYAPEAYNALYEVFDPVRRLDCFLSEKVPFRKSYASHWTSESGNDFMSLSSNQECHFSLGSFAFEGKASYVREDHAVFIEFFHQKLTHYLYLKLEDENAPPNSARSIYRPTRAKAIIHHFDDKNLSRKPPSITDYETTLTKQSHSNPAP